ncbi:MAG: FG-GAP repeat domain-containing protein [Candidatus Rokuibacteriota bacterium]
MLLALALLSLSAAPPLRAQGSVSFAPGPGSPVPAGNSPQAVVAADLNTDGKVDLVTANFTSNNVTILLGNGQGGFAQAGSSPVDVGSGPTAIAVGDFNQDGSLDLAVTNLVSSILTILLGNGQGQFSQASGSPITVEGGPLSVAVGDFNSDGKPDLATANAGDSVTILLGNGQGQFTQATGSPIQVEGGPTAVAVGDFTRGSSDLVVTNGRSNSVTILLGNGQGGFSVAPDSPIAVGNGPQAVAVGDFTSDGNRDLAVVNAGSRTVTILLGNGQGQFSQAQGSPVGAGSNPQGTAVGDFTRDGNLDLAVVDAVSGTLTILLGDGFGQFGQAAGSPIAVGFNPLAVAVGDFTGDGALDLAVANADASNVSVLLNTTSSTTTACFAPATGSPITVGTFPGAVAVGDFNHDGPLDLAVTNGLSFNVSILLGNGLGGFSPAPGSPISVGRQPVAVAAGDFDADGNLDLAVVDAADANVTILLGNGQGSFTRATGSPFAVGLLPFSIAVGDLNNDGKLDLVTGNLNSDNVTVLLGNGQGQFSQATGSPIAVGVGPAGVQLGDFTNDGKLDLAVSNEFSNNLMILLGNGQGQFTNAPGSPIAVDSPAGLAVSDLNGDGQLDIASTSNDSIVILLGDGRGRFTEATGSPIAAGNAAVDVAVGDFNHDGTLDLAVASIGSNNVTILLGNGQGQFTQAPGSPIPAGNGTTAIRAGDLTNDGIVDLAVVSRVSATVTVLLGNAPCPPPSARPAADCQAAGALCHVNLRAPGAPGGVVIATGRIVSGPCPRSGACLQFESRVSFTVSGSLSGVPVGAIATVRIPVVDTAGTPIGSREVRCSIADRAGRVRCDTTVAEQGAFPRLDGKVQLSVSSGVR